MTELNDDENDLFQNIADLPEDLQAILSKYDERFQADENGYLLCKELLAEVEALGYTFEYGLDAEPFGLRLADDEGSLDLDDGFSGP
jgi:hypothetical protein